MAYCVQLDAELSPNLPLGGKAASLAVLSRAGFPVLPGLVLLPQAFWDSLRFCNGNGIERDRPTTPATPTQLDPVVLTEVRTLIPKLSAGGRWIVRSSALKEDGAHQSFAGQLDSVLGVDSAQLETAILQVWRSAFSQTLQTYRQQQGLTNPPKPPAVLIQPMLKPEASGIAFGADPLTGRRGISVVTGVYGLPVGLASGDTEGDCYTVSREGQILERRLASKSYSQQLDEPSGELRREALADSLRHRAVLTDVQILEVAQLVREVGHHQSRPQDVEWAIAQDRLYLLQARPITTLATQSDPDGTYCLWDNSNIVESYSGVTTPLTFSFARKAYTEVYRQFCRFMGVPNRLVEQNRTVFSNMIGFLQGRIYYNLLNWYRVLTLLPGYRLNARFLEQMLGVQKGLPKGVMTEIRRQNRAHPIADSVRLGVSALRIVANYLTLNRRIRCYQQRLNRVLLSAADLQRLPDMRPDELVQLYRRIEGKLLSHWDAPLINDFFAMIFYGVLKALIKRWGKDLSSNLQNDLISVTGEVISAEPARRMQQMADRLMEQPAAIPIFCSGSLAEIQHTLTTLPDLEAAYQDYLAKFGDRTLEELKLESPTLADDPLPLLRTIGCLAQRQLTEPLPGDPSVRACLNRRLAQQELFQSLPLWRRCILSWVLYNTRQLVRNRENLRFERTRVFGQARRVFLELGKRFYALGLLEAPTDIFFLEVEEIMGVIEGTGATLALQDLAAVRQRQWEQQQAAPPLPRRVETFGLPYLVNSMSGSEDASENASGDADQGAQNTAIAGIADTADTTENPEQGLESWTGMGCSPGIVQGRVSLISNPRQWLQGRNHFTVDEPAILVAASTDPGWVLLFPHAQGLLVERGSLLSHVAILARELGLPMITDLPNITTLLQDGDWIEMDGHTGQIRRLAVAMPSMEQTSGVSHAL